MGSAPVACAAGPAPPLSQRSGDPDEAFTRSAGAKDGDAGTWRLSRQDLQEIAKALGLPNRRSKHAAINPANLSTVEEFGMLPGMVSPFLRPMRATRLTALVVLPWPRYWEEQGREVAVSLSLWESLVLPLSCLHSLLRCYAEHTYPAVRLIDLHEREGASEPPHDAGIKSSMAPTIPDAHLLDGMEQKGARR